MDKAETMRCVTAARTDGPAPLCGQSDIAPWSLAEAAHVDRYPWYTGGLRQATEVRLLYDASALYVQFICQDVHSSSEVTELNGGVCEDSCVEIFASFDPQAGPHYFNLEINCCGTILVGFGAERQDRSWITPELAERISVATSIKSRTKQESADDRCWWAAAAVGFDVLSELAQRPIGPVPGGWRANFYRCGGKTEPQHACWNDISLPMPDFHCPEFFGRMMFARL